MKKKLNVVKEILSWVLLVAMICLMVFTVYSSYQARQNDEPFFLFGHRPILVLTGSMEPYMLTNGICLTKEVTSIDQLEIGDVITYCTDNAEGNKIRITHRIIDLVNGQIFTKGDNNPVDDGFALTIDNVESEVVAVFNGTAWLVQKWQTTSGKVMIISFAVGIILLCYMAKLLLKEMRRSKNNDGSEDGTPDVSVPADSVEPENVQAESNEDETAKKFTEPLIIDEPEKAEALINAMEHSASEAENSADESSKS